MDTVTKDTVLGIVFVLLAGIGTGTMAWPLKAARKYKFEHLWPLGMFVGIFVVPWVIVLTSVHDPFAAYAEVDSAVLIKANIFTIAWGVANVLFGICIVRIGAALAGAILASVGVSIGVVVPIVFKASGIFQNAPAIGSMAGIAVLSGVITMVIGVLVSAYAGFGRDKVLGKTTEASGNFRQGLILIVLAGILSCGISFSFAYAQGPIVDAMLEHGAGDIAANMAVWAIAFIGGTLVNIIYPAYLMTKDKSWGVLTTSGRDFLLAIAFGIQFIAAMLFLGRGMLYLGALGASVGFGIMQGMQILGSVAVGLFFGEWKGVHGRPIYQLYTAIVIMIVAILIMAYGNTLVGV